ncbi:MAG: Fic family protein [Nitrosopumilaceae archaeon]
MIPPDRSFLIETNRKVINEHPEVYDVIGGRGDELDSVLEIFESVGSDDEPENLIIKAAHLALSISWVQPFLGGNKRTALLAATTFLEENGYSLEILPEDEGHIRELLYRIQDLRSDLDSSIIDKMILYICKNIKKL